MSNKLQQILRLPPVRTAPFFAAGILLCAGGGVAAIVLTTAAALIAMLTLLYHKRMLPSMLALLLGMLSVSSYTAFVCRPLEDYGGTTQHLTLQITEQYKGNGYSYCECSTVIGGRKTTLSFYGDDGFSVGDVLEADVSLTAIAGRTGARERVLRGTIQEVCGHTTPDFSLRRAVSEFRRKLQQEISAYITGDSGALAQGLLFGDTSGFSAELYHAARVSGVVHFTAVSGSHFVIIMSVLLQLAGNYRRLRSAMALVCVPLAVMFFGSEPSVIRAGIMVFLCNCGPLFSRQSESINSLCVSVLIMTAFTPYVMLDIGFQMSVLGVFGVSVVGPRAVYIVRRHTGRLPKLIRLAIDAMTISACAVICIAPVSVSAFGGISLTGVFATLVLTPVFTFALTIAVIFAFTGLTPLLIPLDISMRAAMLIIKTFGCDSSFWLTLDYPVAGLLALTAAVALTASVVWYDERRDAGFAVFVVSMALAVGLSFISAADRRKIEFVSNGSSGAAVICIKNDATIVICGNGASLESELADSLLRNGIRSIRAIIAEGLDEKGARSLEILRSLYPIESVRAGYAAEQSLTARLNDTEISSEGISRFAIDGITIACAKAGDSDISADIVMYYGYKKHEPPHSAELPLYVSSRQEILPENGINIYDTPYAIKLEITEK